MAGSEPAGHGVKGRAVLSLLGFRDGKISDLGRILPLSTLFLAMAQLWATETVVPLFLLVLTPPYWPPSLTNLEFRHKSRGSRNLRMNVIKSLASYSKTMAQQPSSVTTPLGRGLEQWMECDPKLKLATCQYLKLNIHVMADIHNIQTYSHLC
jgi:hypothetical protein